MSALHSKNCSPIEDEGVRCPEGAQSQSPGSTTPGQGTANQRCALKGRDRADSDRALSGLTQAISHRPGVRCATPGFEIVPLRGTRTMSLPIFRTMTLPRWTVAGDGFAAGWHGHGICVAMSSIACGNLSHPLSHGHANAVAMPPGQAGLNTALATDSLPEVIGI